VCDNSCWKCYAGNYSDYVHFAQQRQQERVAETNVSTAGVEKTAGPSRGSGPVPDSSNAVRRKRELPYRKTEEIERDIAEKEATIRRLDAEMADPQIVRAADRIREITRLYAEATADLERLYRHWEEAIELN